MDHPYTQMRTCIRLLLSRPWLDLLIDTFEKIPITRAGRRHVNKPQKTTHDSLDICFFLSLSLCLVFERTRVFSYSRTLWKRTRYGIASQGFRIAFESSPCRLLLVLSRIVVGRWLSNCLCKLWNASSMKQRWTYRYWTQQRSWDNDSMLVIEEQGKC